jgi:hypothetical protein
MGIKSTLAGTRETRKERTQIDYEVPYAYPNQCCWLKYSRRCVNAIDSDQAISINPDFDEAPASRCFFELEQNYLIQIG